MVSETHVKTQNDIRSSTILVTGGCGFIGSHLVERLISLAPKKIVVLDSLEYGTLSNLPSSPLIQTVQHRLGFDDSSLLDKYLDGTEYVFHLAAEKYNQSIQEPERVIRANIIGTEQLLSASGRAGIKKFVFTSSLYAYGRMHGEPYKETDALTPKTVYGISKVAGEHLVNQYAEQFSFDSAILRLMFTYGPRQYANLGYKSVIVKSFERAMQGLPTQICGDGQQVLDYIYVDDVVDSLLLAIRLSGKDAVFNVGSGNGETVKSLMKIILQLAKSSIAPEYIPADRTAGTSRVAAIDKVTFEGWRPKTTLEDGLKAVLDDLRRRTGGCSTK